MENSYVIESLKDFLEVLNNWQEKMNDKEVTYPTYYRGQSNINWILEPSIFRDNYLNVEHKLYYEMMMLKPTDFNNHLSTFEQLSLMQHYDLPTRLLDVTSNPLVALYFATDEKEKENGCIYFFNDFAVESDSTKVKILSNLAKIDKESYSTFKSKLFEEAVQNISDKDILQTINSSILVKAKFNNERILRQNGAFLLFGSNIQDEIVLLNDNFEENEINKIFPVFNKLTILSRLTYEIVEINNDAKNKIRKELEMIGIHRGTLFPEMYSQAIYLKEKYKIDSQITKEDENDYVKILSLEEEKPKVVKPKINNDGLYSEDLITEITEKLITLINDHKLDETKIKNILNDNLVIDWDVKQSTLSSLKRDFNRYFKANDINDYNFDKIVEEIKKVIEINGGE